MRAVTTLSMVLAAGAVALATVAVPAGGQAASAASSVGVNTVGDMACAPADPYYRGGAGTSTHCQQGKVSNLMVADGAASAVFGLGDFQYDCDRPADLAAVYGPTYGRLNRLLDPVVGNHEYKTGKDPQGNACPSSNSTAAGYFNYFGASSHPATKGHYSFNLGSWHVVALNANCAQAGGCSATSSQTAWLRSDLAATNQSCIAAMWHQPLYQGKTAGTAKAYQPWWDALIAAHADVVLNGHVHNYQRFAAMDSAGHVSASGLTEYVVGTGGENLAAVPSGAVPHPVTWRKQFGYLHVDLGAGSWHSAFIGVDGKAYDNVTGTCHS